MGLLLASLKSGQLGLQRDLPVQTHVYSYGGDYPLDAHLHKPVIGLFHQREELLEAIGLHCRGHRPGNKPNPGLFQDVVYGFDVISGTGSRSHGDHGEFGYYHDNDAMLQGIEMF